MCGIVGYIGPRDATPIILDGLKRLEYRGYDSAGLAVFNGGQLEVRKDAGKLSQLVELVSKSPIQRRARHRTYALGNAWRAVCTQRASASRPDRTRGGCAKRHRRELSRIER